MYQFFLKSYSNNCDSSHFLYNYYSPCGYHNLLTSKRFGNHPNHLYMEAPPPPPLPTIPAQALNAPILSMLSMLLGCN